MLAQRHLRSVIRSCVRISSDDPATGQEIARSLPRLWRYLIQIKARPWNSRHINNW
jgi:hypothetical protein